MNDISILYYTCNQISDLFANNVRDHLLNSSQTYNGGTPIISISHKPLEFGKNICVGELEPSPYHIYKQILIGAKAAKTKYVGMAEDDSLYLAEHFEHRPPDDSFSYNVNRWNLNRDSYFYRERCGMCMCIAPRDLIIRVLEDRFAKYPTILPRAELRGFGEPGRYEKFLGLPPVNLERFRTKYPTITFNHRPSTGGVRKMLATDKIEKELPYWGNAKDLWERIHG